MSESRLPTASRPPTHSESSSMASIQREDGASGPNENGIPRTHSYVDCTLDQAFASSAPTPARLSDILETCFQPGGEEHFQPGKRYYIPIFGSGDEYFMWEIVDPVMEGGSANSENIFNDRSQGLMELIRRRWPKSFGHLKQYSDGTPSGFCWGDASPDLLRAAFYPLAPQGQSRRRVIFRDSVKTSLPYRAGTSFAQSTAVPGTPHVVNVEPVVHGRIWALTIPSRKEYEAKVMPYNVLAFLGNYCQTVGVFHSFQDVDDQPGGNHPYALGCRFAQSFIRAKTSCHLELRRFASPDAWNGIRAKPGELVIQYHTRYLAPDRQPFDIYEEQDPPIPSGIKLRRETASIRHTTNPRPSLFQHAMSIHRFLYEHVSSLSLSILNTVDAPYTIIVLTDHDTYSMSGEKNRQWSRVWRTSDTFFPNADSAEINGLRPSGRCLGLSQFLLMALTIFERWEGEWMSSLEYLDSVAAFSLEDTLQDSSLDLLMFDESFQLSRTYFATLQTLQVASRMVDSDIEQWAHLREQWLTTVRFGGMFSAEDLDASAYNWGVVTAVIEARARRVRTAITHKSEAVTSLRDGLFNATSLRESTKGIALNRAVYVFTVVTVLYTPIGFLATFWAMPVFNEAGDSSTDNPDDRYTLPNGFLASFITVPLLTYLLCIAVVWTMGFNATDRRRALKVFWHVVGFFTGVFSQLRRRLGGR